MSQPRRSSRKKRQTQLSFTPLPSSSPAASRYPDQIQRRPAAVLYNDNMSSPTKKRRVAEASFDHSSSSPATSPLKSVLIRQNIQVLLNSPGKKANQLPTPVASSQPVAQELGDSDPGTPLLSRSQRPKIGVDVGGPVFGKKPTTIEGNSANNSTSEEEITPIRRGRRMRAAPVIVSSAEGSDSQEAPEPRTPKNRRKLQRHVQGFTTTPLSGSDGDLGIRPSRQKLRASPKSKSHDSQAERPINIPDSESPKRLAPRINDPVVIPSGGEESTSEEEVVTPARRRRSTAHIGTVPTEHAVSEREDSKDSEDIDEEVADLKDTGTSCARSSHTSHNHASTVDVLLGLADISVAELRKSRTRGRQDTSERSKRQRKLEELRRRRAGGQADTDEDNEEDSFASDPDSDLEPLDHAIGRGDNLDQYEDDFVDDEDDTVGVDLGVAGVPLEFTYHANKKPFEHFKTEVEWMVHNRLNPAFDRRDEIYLLAHRKLDIEVQGLGSSKFESSVWRENFTRALKSRPDLYRLDVPTMFERKCDACQRSNHPPKHKVSFTGKPYDRDTLETIEKGEDEEDSNDSDGEEEQGEKTESGHSEHEDNFFLGRFCCANAEMVHALHHWRYSLNQTVLQWLANDGHLTPEKIIERENLRQKKREKAANKVVDGMEATGVMKELYLQFKQNLEAARDAKPKYYMNGR